MCFSDCTIAKTTDTIQNTRLKYQNFSFTKQKIYNIRPAVARLEYQGEMGDVGEVKRELEEARIENVDFHIFGQNQPSVDPPLEG